VQYAFLSNRHSGRDHQQITLAAQFVTTAAFAIYRHEGPDVHLPASAPARLLTLKLLRPLPPTSFQLAQAFLLALFRRSSLAFIPFAQTLTFTPGFKAVVTGIGHFPLPSMKL